MRLTKTNALALLPLFLSCTNTFWGSVPNPLPSLSPEPTSYTVQGIQKVLFEPNPRQAKLFLDSDAYPSGAQKFCEAYDPEMKASPCMCQFEWNEVNSNITTSETTIPRRLQIKPSSIQDYLVLCPLPETWTSEMPMGTKLTTSLIRSIPPDIAPPTPNASIAPHVGTYQGLEQGGSFQDIQGNLFDSILRYTCYQRILKGLEVQSYSVKLQDSETSGEVRGYSATQFCFNMSTGSSSSGSGCAFLPPISYTAQSSFLHFYIRSTERGDINRSNDSITCPTIVEDVLRYSGSSANQYYPLDASFALALDKSPSFSVGVAANSKVSNGGDPVTGTGNNFNACEKPTQSTGSESGGGPTVVSCLGFAAPARKDGTCGTITKSDGSQLQLYRLRRFFSIYPKVFEANGEPLKQIKQTIDTIYVIDRPVRSSSGAVSPFSMLGPKPCPFSYFDARSVTGAIPGYVASSNTAWNGKNVDGTELPNIDQLAGNKTPSCSALLPVFGFDETNNYEAYLGFRTVNKMVPNTNNSNKNVYISPVKAFTPHYEEDMNFQACAPLAEPLRDPPLHLSRDASSGQVAWCAETYPTQNPFVSTLDPITPENPAGIGIKPFTSHTVKGVVNNTPCLATTNLQFAAGHSSAHPGRHLGADAATCDRTVSSGGMFTPDWVRFPLLATDTEIEQAISVNKSYYCTVTRDETSEKKGTSVPATGCCDPTRLNLPSSVLATGSAHAEPTEDSACGTPIY